jgi:hypothetical protein
MLKKISRLISILKNPSLAKALVSYSYHGYLHENGWVNSFLHKMPVDISGQALPWVTYPFIDFIGDRFSKEMTIFEYGSGNSTFYYAQKVKAVVSIEHDKKWYDQVSTKIPDNVTLLYQDLSSGLYAQSASVQGIKFDVVIVDGRDRVNCIKNALEALKEQGVMVLDDSERSEYQTGCQYLMENGFKRLDFWGIAPGLFYKKCTSVFYKPSNCLAI